MFFPPMNNPALDELTRAVFRPKRNKCGACGSEWENDNWHVCWVKPPTTTATPMTTTNPASQPSEVER